MQVHRLRRLRKGSIVRDWVSETRLNPKNIILPYFVVEGKGIKEPIKSMPGVYHFSLDNLLKDITETSGISSILLFGIPKSKDKLGSQAHKEDGIIQIAVGAIKEKFKDLIVITDLCICGYTSHGHCGVIKKNTKCKIQNTEYKIDNDATLEILAKIAISQARAGTDFVAPSGMMDGGVRTIRQALDRDGFKDVGILAYSAKYASSFYGPFREAQKSTMRFGDRKTYQMDFRNSDEALREIGHDVDEGADIVMIKPALAYLDIIYRVKEKFNMPVAAYSVSGEYSMIKRYCQKIKDKKERMKTEKELILEIITSIKRAGADFIITYHAREVAGWLKEF